VFWKTLAISRDSGAGSPFGAAAFPSRGGRPTVCTCRRAVYPRLWPPIRISAAWHGRLIADECALSFIRDAGPAG